MKTRQSNFELLRIVCMLMVMGGHVLISQEAMVEVGTTDYYIGNIYRSFAIGAVDVFVLITGYFGVHFNPRKLLKLSAQVFFYSVFIFVIALIFGIHELNIRKDILLFFPVISQRYWFITIYFLLVLISPLLNRIVDSLGKNEYTFLVIFNFIVFNLWPTLSYSLAAPAITKDGGYGIVNFTVLYLLGRYCKKYMSDMLKDKGLSIWLTIFSVGLLFGANTFMTAVLGFYFQQYISYDSVFCLFVAFTLFIAFRNMEFQSDVINRLSKNSLSAYIIHAHPVIWSYFWAKDTGVINHNLHGIELVAWIILVPVGIYFVTWFIEEGRVLLFGKTEDIVLDKIVNSRLMKYVTDKMKKLENVRN